VNTLTRFGAALAAASLAVVLSACAPLESGDGPAAPATEAPSLDRPAALADVPDLELLAPGATDAGGSPVFSWAAVEGATTYRLAVVRADGPVWAWDGQETEVRFGGFADEPDAGAGVLRLGAAAWWSVTAYDADDTLLAASGLRAVSPDGAAPDPLATAADADAAASEAPKPALDSACGLYSDDEAREFLEGELREPGHGGIDDDGLGLSCSWERADDEFLTLDVTVRPEASREKWDEYLESMLEYDPELQHSFPDLGDASYLTEDWGGTRLEVMYGDVLVIVRSGWTGGAGPASMDIARLLFERYEDALG